MKPKVFWKHAIDWLEENSPTPLSKKDLHSYFDHQSGRERPSTINDLYLQFLTSLTQAGMLQGVIVASMPSGMRSLSKVTFSFSPSRTDKHYGGDYLALFSDIQAKIKPTGKLRDEGLWPKYCKTVLSTAQFLRQFDDAPAFYAWTEDLKSSPTLRSALPLLLSEELFGAGFALACNILIDLGYSEFAKPDRHVKRILHGAGFLAEDASDYKALKCMFELCDGAGISPYALDKALFLIGSGNYFRHQSLQVTAKRDRTAQFLSYLKDA